MTNRQLLTEDEARDIITPHLDDLRACLVEGWAAWREFGQFAPHRSVHTSTRSRAGIVYDAIVAEAVRRFSGKPGVNTMREHGFLIIVFDGRLVLRFKKYRHGFRTSNIPTQQQMAFTWQAEIDGMPPEATKVVAGYLLNALQDQFRQIAITCRMGPNLVWIIDIPDAPAIQLPIPTPMPLRPAASEPSRPRVRPAKRETKESANGGAE